MSISPENWPDQATTTTQISNSEETKATAASIIDNKENAHLNKGVMLDQRYEVKHKIDEGTYSKVYLA